MSFLSLESQREKNHRKRKETRTVDRVDRGLRLESDFDGIEGVPNEGDGDASCEMFFVGGGGSGGKRKRNKVRKRRRKRRKASTFFFFIVRGSVSFFLVLVSGRKKDASHAICFSLSNSIATTYAPHVPAMISLTVFM